ncbi:cytochrome P450 [Trametes elegans]|nr:cytochrome P450 [Trametes elegans]
MSLTDVLPGFGPLLGVLFVLYFGWLYLKYSRNPLLRLPGPPENGLWGYARSFWTTDPTELHEEWVRLYGRTMSYRVVADVCLYTTDTKALAQILSHDNVYQKPHKVRTFIAEMLGTGILLSEGTSTSHTRETGNPAFGPVQIREFNSLFLDKASQLRDILASMVFRNAGIAPVDMYTWMHRLTLDVIGEAAFGCNLGTLDLDQKPNELCDAFRLVSHSVTRMSLLPMLRFFFPVLRIFPDEQTRRFRRARKTMRRFATKVIAQKRKEMGELLERLGGKQGRRRKGNFLSLLVEANMSSDLLEGQRLSDETMVDGTPCRVFFLVAGHETTSATLAWIFYEIGRYPVVQEKLRSELFTIPSERPTMDELASLHYLDCVIREAIRLHPSIPSSLRVAVEDDSVTLGTPVVARDQTTCRLFVCKGTPIVIPILAINRDKSLWGEDAFEFRPERWDALPDAVLGIPGIWGHNLTFMGGQHACLGYRFALNEIKAVMFTLLRAFHFELAVAPNEIGASPTLLSRPIHRSDTEHGPQLPMLVSPC